MLHVKKLSWLFVLPAFILFNSCTKSTLPPPPVDETEWLQQPRGAVVETGDFACGYFILQNQWGYSVMQNNGAAPFIGSIVYGQHSNWGYNVFYNRSSGYLFRANVVDYGLGYFAALDQLQWYCRDPFEQ
jgi:hypothetical protein